MLISKGAIDTMKMQIITACTSRKFAVTERRYIGLVPHCAKEGDILAILCGAPIPFVLRVPEIFPNPAQTSLESPRFLVGDAYVHGVMDGEVLVDKGFEKFIQLV